MDVLLVFIRFVSKFAFNSIEIRMGNRVNTMFSATNTLPIYHDHQQGTIASQMCIC